jgi:hypothetical protein
VNLIKPQSWGQTRPPIGSQIDWGHPLARGLAVCVPCNEKAGLPLEMVTRQRFTPSGNAWWANVGPTTSVAGIWRLSYPSGGPIESKKITTEASILWRGRKIADELGSYGYYFGISYNNFVADPYNVIALDVNNNDASGVRVVTNGGSGVLIDQCRDTTPLPFHVPLQMLGTVRNGSQKLWVRSASQPADAQTQTMTSILTHANDGVAIGTHGGDNNRTSGGAMEAGYVWNRVLTPDEVAWLYAEPYAFFTPPTPKTMYIPLDVPPAPQVATAMILNRRIIRKEL